MLRYYTNNLFYLNNITILYTKKKNAKFKYQ